MLAAMLIARAVEVRKAKVTVYVPVYAMSGGTLIALAADEIVLGEFSVLGPIDPQIAGLPAASIVKARDSKAIESVFDLTLVLADVAEKALAQVKHITTEQNRDPAERRRCRTGVWNYRPRPGRTAGMIRRAWWRPHSAGERISLDCPSLRQSREFDRDGFQG